MYCQDCAKRGICSQLCPEAEVFANQDYVSQKELTIGIISFQRKTITPLGIAPSFTFRERQIFSLMCFGFSKKDITKTLNISKENLKKHLQNLNHKIK